MLKTMKPLYPKPHRNQLLEGLRPTLELNTFNRWPGVSCSPLPLGLHILVNECTIDETFPQISTDTLKFIRTVNELLS